MINIEYYLSSFLNQTSHLFISTPVYVNFLTVLTITVAFLCGKRLRTFSKAEAPYVSTFLRLIGKLLHQTTKLLLISIVCLTLVVYLLSLVLKVNIASTWLYASSHLMVLVAGTVCGVLISALASLRLIPRWEKSDEFEDVEQILKMFKKFHGYDPLKFINIKKGCFVGKDRFGKPIYIDWHKINESHAQVLGESGAGKGVILGLIAYQCILQGQPLVWFDPKFDSHSPKLLMQAAETANTKFHFVNLNPNQSAQFNLFADCTENELEEMLVAGFNLRPTGGESDFYRGKDEDAALLMAHISISENLLSVPELFQHCQKVSEIIEQENFWRKFKKLASLEAINTKEGLNLKNAVLNGEIIYIVGSTENERVIMLQKMLMVRILQIIKGRDRAVKNRPTCLVFDEFKYLLSSTSISALGVIRDFDAHCILAHQSLGDLEECVGVSPKAAYGAVLDNTSLKFVYKISDADHAERLSKLAGKKRSFTSSTHISVNADSNVGSWHETASYLIPPELITHLPTPKDRPKQASTGILFGLGKAKLFYVSPIQSNANLLPATLSVPPYATKAVVQSAQEEI